MIYTFEEITHLLIDNFISPRLRKRTVTPIQNEDISLGTPLDPHLSHNHHSHDAPIQLLQDSDTFQASIRGFMVIFALSLHAVFEGVALGLAGSSSSVWYLFFAIAAHKYVISFCVGAQFVRSSKKNGCFKNHV